MRELFVSLSVCCLLFGVGESVFAQANCSCMEGSLDDKARLCLPAAIEGFQTKPVPEEHRALLKSFRNSVGGGYNEPARQLAISVYFYDREIQDEPSDIKEVRGSVVDVLRLHPGARVETGTSSLPLAGNPTEARGGLLTWRVGPKDYGSFLWVISRTSRWIKIRATYIRPPGKEAEAMEYAAESVRKVVSSICALHDEVPQKAYMLESFSSGFALYPGAGYRSFIDDKYNIDSFAKLIERVGQLPAGTQVFWPSEELRRSREGKLFSDEELENLRALCRKRHINLVVQ